MYKVSFIFGTRPEAIKLCPVILKLKSHPFIQVHICVTGQHREMLDQVLSLFDVKPDVDLDLMQKNQTLSKLTSRTISKIDEYLQAQKPDIVIVQGDTTTVFCASLAAFYNNIPVGHIEAGLRTWNKHSPFPEEINRVLTSRIADVHYAPTILSRKNLLKEGISEDNILVTGNTVIDALMMIIERARIEVKHIHGLPDTIFSDDPLSKMVLITGHRRENFGAGFLSICNAIAELAKRFKDVNFVYPVHLNPNVQLPVNQILNDIENVYLVRPLSYLPFTALLDKATIVLTDSGGIQEEAPSLGKPVLVMRDTTERPEAVDAGTVRLIGTDKANIISSVSELLTDNDKYNSMAVAINPYGDGKSSDRIIKHLYEYLQEEATRS
jgi:UDP-N-acetylglucosamine 2-epimerase (non-hydrolysing)